MYSKSGRYTIARANEQYAARATGLKLLGFKRVRDTPVLMGRKVVEGRAEYRCFCRTELVTWKASSSIERFLALRRFLDPEVNMAPPCLKTGHSRCRAASFSPSFLGLLITVVTGRVCDSVLTKLFWNRD